MHRFVLSILSLLLCYTVSARQLTINGTIDHMPDSSVVILCNAQDQDAVLAKAVVYNHRFVIVTTLEEPILLKLKLKNDWGVMLFAGNDMVTINGSLSMPSEEWAITGSSVQADYKTYQHALEPLLRQLQSMQGIPVQDSLMGVKYLKVLKNVQVQTDSFIQHHLSSPVSPYALLQTFDYTDDLMVIEQRFSRLKPSVQQTALATQLKQAIRDVKYNRIGSHLLNFTLPDTAGLPVSLSQFKGKYVLLDFWASWCGPCKQQNFKLVRIFEKYADKGFTILSVSVDDDKKRWLFTINHDDLNWTHVSDLKGWNNAVAVKYAIRSIPRNMLLDPEGRILARNLQPDQLENKLGELF